MLSRPEKILKKGGGSAGSLHIRRDVHRRSVNAPPEKGSCMAPGPEEQLATLADPGAPVQLQLEDQRHDWVHQIPAGWLDREHLAQAERVDRLAADYDLVTTLALRRFEGAEYDYFANELAKYGMAVISGWMRRGVILWGAPAIGLLKRAGVRRDREAWTRGDWIPVGLVRAILETCG